MIKCMTRWRLDSGQIEVMDDDVARVLRCKTPAQRVAMIGAAHRTAKSLLRASVKRRHPDWNPAQIDQEVARRLLRGTA